MAVTCECPSCGRRLLVPEDVWNRRVSCPTCRSVFVPAESAPAPTPAAPAPPKAPPSPRQVRADRTARTRDREEGADDTDSRVRASTPVPPDYEPLPDGAPLPGKAAALAAIALLVVSALIHLTSAGAQLAHWRIIQRVAAGERVVPAEERPLVLTIQALARVQLLVVLGTAVAFCIWFYQAHRNLNRLRVRGLHYTPGWAAGSFFVPILNLFRPYQIAQETWKASDPVTADDQFAWRKRPGSRLVGAWWTFWLLYNISGTIASRVLLVGPRRSLASMEASAVAYIVYHLLGIVAAALAIAVIMRIRDRQGQKYERLLSG